MNKISFFSATAFCAIICSTCSTPDQVFMQQAQAFADMNENTVVSSSGVKCASFKEIAKIADNIDTVYSDIHSGIICIED